MKQPKVVVLSYGSGNVRSAVRALERVGAQVELTADPAAVENADGLVVPGVGAFASVMRQLASVDGPRLIDRRLAGGRPVLGICVGMQVMFEGSTEFAGDEGASSGRGPAADAGAPPTADAATEPTAEPITQGLAQWPGIVRRLDAPIVPHMGWSEVRPPESTLLFRGVEGERFYFVHSYAATEDPATLMDPGPTTLPRTTWASHGHDFVAAVENGALMATQFHPEKSGDAGAQLLENWLTTLA